VPSRTSRSTCKVELERIPEFESHVGSAELACDAFPTGLLCSESIFRMAHDSIMIE